nr:MAG TPA: hypothetical protein [Caudoviricetes sp.]
MQYTHYNFVVLVGGGRSTTIKYYLIKEYHNGISSKRV